MYASSFPRGDTNISMCGIKSICFGTDVVIVFKHSIFVVDRNVRLCRSFFSICICNVVWYYLLLLNFAPCDISIDSGVGPCFRPASGATPNILSLALCPYLIYCFSNPIILK